MKDTTDSPERFTASDLFGLAREVLANLSEYHLKLHDAPASAQTHFDKAVFLLSEKCRNWQPSDHDVIAFVRGSREHMSYYYAAANEPWPNVADETRRE